MRRSVHRENEPVGTGGRPKYVIELKARRSGLYRSIGRLLGVGVHHCGVIDRAWIRQGSVMLVDRCQGDAVPRSFDAGSKVARDAYVDSGADRSETIPRRRERQIEGRITP